MLRPAKSALMLAAALAAAPAAAASSLKAVTLNVAASARGRLEQRLAAISAALRDDGDDVAALQEAPGPAAVGRMALASGLTHSAYFDGGWPPGAGLAILSRYPIAQTRTLTYTCRPSPWKLYRRQALANKGALMARVRTPRGPLDVYDTRLIGDSGSARYLTLRLTQIFELSQFVARHSRSRPFLILGDLNMEADAPAYRVLIDLLGLQDACVRDGEDECGLASDEEGPRLDHALLPDGPRAARAEAAFAEPIPGTNLPYSEREGVAAMLSPAAMRLRLGPDPRRKLEALMRVESAIDQMEAQLRLRRARASWIPIYGFAALLRYDRQLAQLSAVRDRVETERIAWLSGRPSAELHG